ncbi:MAG: hypothetical protein E7287_08890 [Lachnospiraceae bacterium]|nr:hypothetical protein [Lachnospiraceae bacterium]
MKRRWSMHSLIAGMLFVFCMAGCGEPAVQEIEKDTVVKQEVDWEQGFKVGEVKQAQDWNTCDFTKLEPERTGEGTYTSGRVLKTGGEEYTELLRYKSGEQVNYYVKRTSPEGEDISETYIDQSNWEMDKKAIFHFDESGNQMYFGVKEQGNAPSEFSLPENVWIVTTDREGKLISQRNLHEGLAALGCDEDPGWFYVDGEGYCYVQTQDNSQRGHLYVIDPEGKGVLSYHCDAPMMDIIYEPVRDKHGRLFFPVYELEEKASLLFWRDTDNQWKELVRLEEKAISTWFGMDENLIYYQYGSDLVRWDVLTGEREALLNLEENGVGKGINGLLAWNEKGELYLRNRSADKDWVVRVTQEPVVYADALVVGTDVAGYHMETIKSGFITFSRENGVPLEIQDDSEKEQSRMFIDMVNGEGPDMLYVRQRDIAMLQEKGALLDIRELLSEEEIERLLPQALELGSFGDGLYGIPLYMEFHTMFVNEEIWSESSWNVEDIHMLVEQNPQIECLFTSDYEDWEPTNFLVMYDLLREKTPYIDWGSRTSCFEEKNFAGLLEKVLVYAKNYYSQEITEIPIGIERMMKRTALGYYPVGCDLFEYCYLMEEVSPKWHAVGIPSLDGSEHYLSADEMLVVNANISEEKKESIKKLLKYMIGEEMQRSISYRNLSVIENLVYDNLQYDPDREEYTFAFGNSQFRSISNDQMAFAEEYNELIKEAKPLYQESVILSIINEEIGAFAAGDSTALEVTRKIDNRVQLYLDENQ